jgi:hypothetical protein
MSKKDYLIVRPESPKDKWKTKMLLNGFCVKVLESTTNRQAKKKAELWMNPDIISHRSEHKDYQHDIEQQLQLNRR